MEVDEDEGGAVESKKLRCLGSGVAGMVHRLSNRSSASDPPLSSASRSRRVGGEDEEEGDVALKPAGDCCCVCMCVYV